MKILSMLTVLLIIGVLISGCLENEKMPSENYVGGITHEETIYNYSTPGFEIDRKQASDVWEKVKYFDEAKFVTSEKSYSAIVFVHPYSAGPFDMSTAEWIVIASSINHKETKIAVFRLDYQTLNLKTFAYNFSYPAGKELTLEHTIVVMEGEMKKYPYGDKFVDAKNVVLLGDNYIYSYPAPDFGGTIIVNRYAGKTIFYADTIWDRKGELIFPGDNETFRKTPIPYIETRVESYNPPAYRGTLTNVTLYLTGSGVTKGTGISLEYKIELLNASGSFRSGYQWVDIIPEKKQLVFPRNMTDWDINLLKSNFTMNVSKEAPEGDYYITVTTKYRGMVVGSNVISFKIGRGGKQDLQEKNIYIENLVFHLATMDIGYTRDHPPPLNETEKAEAKAIAVNDPYLRGKKYEVTGITSGLFNFKNFWGFFPVVEVDAGDPNQPGEYISFIIDVDDKKVLENRSIPRKPIEYLAGQAFDESSANLTRTWNSENFAGFWYDPETNTSNENLLINQSILDSSNRTIGKHNLIYTTYSVPYRFQVFSNVNVTEVAISNLPFGGRNLDYASIPAEEKKETYLAIGWHGEKYASMDSNRITKVLLEQNAPEIRTLGVSESWEMGEGYVLTANSIDAKAATPQAWFMLAKDGIKLYDIVMIPRRLWIFTPENETMPLFITYFNKISAGSYTDEVNFKYTWLRSRNTTEIKPGGIFGVMEVTSVDNGRIELRNRVPIELAPGATINLMGNLFIKVENSNTSLSFHPYRVKDPNVR